MYLPDLTFTYLKYTEAAQTAKKRVRVFGMDAHMHTCTCYVQSAQPQPFTAIMTRYVWLAAPRHCPMQPRGEGERESLGRRHEP